MSVKKCLAQKKPPQKLKSINNGIHRIFSGSHVFGVFIEQRDSCLVIPVGSGISHWGQPLGSHQVTRVSLVSIRPVDSTHTTRCQ